MADRKNTLQHHSSTKNVFLYVFYRRIVLWPFLDCFHEYFLEACLYVWAFLEETSGNTGFMLAISRLLFVVPSPKGGLEREARKHPGMEHDRLWSMVSVQRIDNLVAPCILGCTVFLANSKVGKLEWEKVFHVWFSSLVLRTGHGFFFPYPIFPPIQ